MPAFVFTPLRIVLLALTLAVAGCEPAPSPPARTTAPPPALATLYAEVHAQLDREHPGLGITDYPGHTVEHIPKAYAMVLAAELARRPRAELAALPDLGATAGAWLLEHADVNHDGVIGWGLPVAWDAYGDGSVNPAHSEYTIATAVVVEALLDWLEHAPSATRPRIRATLEAALRPYLEPAMRSPSGLLPYSLSPADRRYDTFNPAAYLAGQMQRYSGMVTQPVFSRQLREVADASMAALLQHRQSSPETGAWYWHYSIQETVANDLPHAAYIIHGIRTYVRHGGRLAGRFDLPRVLAHLTEFAGPGQQGLRAWPRFRAEVQQPARLYDLGMALHLACTEPGLAQPRQAFLAAVSAYRQGPGAYGKYPVAFEAGALRVREYEAYLLRGLASCLAAPSPLAEPRPLSAARSQEVEAALARPAGPASQAVPLVGLDGRAGQPGVSFDSIHWRSQLHLAGRAPLTLPGSSIPLQVLPTADGHAVILKGLPDNHLSLLSLDAEGRPLGQWRIRHGAGSEPIFRAAALHRGLPHLVYYDNPSERNYLLRFRRAGPGHVPDGPAIPLPSLEDPAGSHYEMVPALHLLSIGDRLHLWGGTLHATLHPGGQLSVERPGDCQRVLEAIATPQGPVALCATDLGRHDAPPFVLRGPRGLALPELAARPGIPWNLRLENGRIRIDHAQDVAGLRALFLRDLEQGQAGGWLEFGSNNEEGRIPWSQIYYLNGFLDILYLARRDAGVQAVFQPLLPGIRRRLDLEIGILDRYWRLGRYATRGFTVGRVPALFAVQTSRLLLLMDRYLREVPDPIDLPAHAGLRRSVRQLDGHIEVLADQGEAAHWLAPGRYHLRWPRGSAFPYDGVAVPYNHQNEWAHAVLTSDGPAAGNDFARRAAQDVVQLFIERIAPGGRLPETGEWDYWWGRAHDGWTEADRVSVNRPAYAGDRGKAWISFRSIDTQAMLAAEYLPPAIQARLQDSAARLISAGHVYPFVARGLAQTGKRPVFEPWVAPRYVRVSAPWELGNAAWAYLSLAGELTP